MIMQYYKSRTKLLKFVSLASMCIPSLGYSHPGHGQETFSELIYNTLFYHQQQNMWFLLFAFVAVALIDKRYNK